MEATSVINLNPSTKKEAEDFANKLVAEVEGGLINPLQLHIKLNAMKKAIEDVTSRIAQQVLSEATKHGAKKFDAYSSEVSITELGTKYNFETCGDPVWHEALEEEKKWAEKRKERETFLKTIRGSMDVIIEGEPLTLKEAVKSSTTGIKVILK